MVCRVPLRPLLAITRTPVQRLLESQRTASAVEAAASSDQEDLGWKTVSSIKSRRRRKRNQATEDTGNGLTEQEIQDSIVRDLFTLVICQLKCRLQKHRGHLLKELAARMARETQLLYALRELELQRQLVGKGGRRKVRGVEEIDADKDGDDSNDEQRETPKQKRGDKTYKPRIYKWRIERKR